MITVKVILVVAVAAAVLSTAFVVAISSFVGLFAAAQDADFKKTTIGGHTSGYGLYETSGDVLDPVNSYSTTSEKVVIDPDKYLRSFDYGRVSKLANGTTLREFTLVADDRQMMEISPGVFYNVWTFNGTIPGPTLRATEGDLIRINFINNGSKPHSIHTHGIHESEMDGVFEIINPRGKFTYEFYAQAFGVFPYHCHVTPLEEHISHGLYGVYIVDPKTPRPQADEMVMIMNGFDTDFDRENNFYAVNTIPFYYMHHPIAIQQDKLVRVYLVNMLEFDQINNFHLHGELYHLYRSGTNIAPDEYTDLVTMRQGERAILEFNFKYPGQYMFHAHKTEFAEKGWVGMFLVKDPAETGLGGGSTSSNRSTLPQTATISGDVVR
jgi:FtsP/CotA-like multicopper oxidase with cupredoxin domain